MIRDYICLDVETTGLQAKLEKIIEIGAVKVRDLKVVDQFQVMINPGRVLEPRIIELTSITQEMVEEGEAITEVLPRFLEFCEDLPILGHNLLFDYGFLKRAAIDTGNKFEKKGLDTLKIARKYLPDLPSRSLGNLCQHYQIEHVAHRALGDAIATHQLYAIFVESFYEEESPVFVPKALSYHAKKQTPATIAQKEQISRICEKYKIQLERDLDLLTRSEASRWMEQVRQKFGKI